LRAYSCCAILVRELGELLKIVIAGASGLVGTATTNALRADGHLVVHLVRSDKGLTQNDVPWDPASGKLDTAAIEGANAIINLAGAGIGESRWSDARKEILRSSRVESTRVLVDAFAKLWQKPQVFLSASATGYYGNRGDEVLTEKSCGGDGFLADLARDWEAQALRAEAFGVRTVLLRFGMILSSHGGALPRMTAPFMLGLGGRLGSGKQWMSWIAIEDVIGAVREALTHESLSGAVNAVSPNPVQNAEFTRVLARVLHRPAIFTAPAFALRVVLGEMADELLLASQRVQPQKLIASGYAFRFPELEPTLQSILSGLHSR
jgi:uncharacterized protein